MNIKECMTPDPIYAQPGDGLHQTYRRMRDHDIRHMPVLDEAGHVIGIVSERDLLRPSYVDPGPNTSRWFSLDNSVKIARAMTPDPITLSEDDSVDRALDLFLQYRFGALPVLSPGGSLSGILSTLDLLRLFQERERG